MRPLPRRRLTTIGATMNGCMRRTSLQFVRCRAADARCWVEHEQVAQSEVKSQCSRGDCRRLIGGIIGHQLGGGRGQDVATAGGAVAGAALGANVGRDGGGRRKRAMSSVAPARPARSSQSSGMSTTPSGSGASRSDDCSPRRHRDRQRAR